MRVWVNQQLDAQLSEKIANMQSQENVELLINHLPFLAAWEAAKTGDINTVLAYVIANPDAASALMNIERRKPAKPGRPKGSFGASHATKVFASADLDRVYQIWKSAYGGRWKRRADNGPSALEIVAVRWGISQDKIAKFRKEHGRVLRV